jgi:hypothetical protein
MNLSQLRPGEPNITVPFSPEGNNTWFSVNGETDVPLDYTWLSLIRVGLLMCLCLQFSSGIRSLYSERQQMGAQEEKELPPEVITCFIREKWKPNGKKDPTDYDFSNQDHASTIKSLIL